MSPSMTRLTKGQSVLHNDSQKWGIYPTNHIEERPRCGTLQWVSLLVDNHSRSKSYENPKPLNSLQDFR